MTDETSLDTPIERATIDRLPTAVLDTWLETIRARRLVVVQKLLTVQAEKQRVHLSEVSERYNKLYERVKTSMDKVDDMINKFEANVNKLRALALELDDVID